MDAVNIVTTVGFPIAACMAIARYYVKVEERNNQTIEKLSEALNNNTLALTKLAERLEKWHKIILKIVAEKWLFFVDKIAFIWYNEYDEYNSNFEMEGF